MNGFGREANSNSVQLQSGTLITWYAETLRCAHAKLTISDIAAKQILVFLDSLRDGPDKFVIQDGELQ
jgi:hypothetical protein